ncbi:UPF0235 protein DET1292-like isoform X2 [Lycorma delicatula]|uniref:UPF0235 protein DET1292-like isoform X2 n=1 Tax=Lycorma delicatula TaxID=130591 RepID=UPI003F519CD6
MYSLFGSNYFRRIGFNLIELISCNRSASVYKMPKKNAKTKINNSSEENKLDIDSAKHEAIELSKDGNILINVHAKPGSKENMIQGEVSFPDQPRLDVKIAARAVEGQANTELVEYLAEVLDVRKSDFTIIRGMKCREKL